MENSYFNFVYLRVKAFCCLVFIVFLIIPDGFAQKKQAIYPPAMQLGNRSMEEEQMDSVIDEEYLKETMEWKKIHLYQWGYDEGGFTSLYAGFLRNDDNTSWINWRKEEYVNDEFGKLVQSAYYVWDGDDNLWNPIQRTQMEYDGNGNLITYFSYSWELSLNEWINQGKGSFNVNQDGETTDDIFYIWDASVELWINDYKDEYTLDNDGNQIESIGYSWARESTEWIPETKNVFVWNENSQMNLRTGYDWNETTHIWELDNKSDFEYDDDGNQVKTTYYIRNGENWVFYTKSETIYEQGIKNQEVRSAWDIVGGQWIYDYRQTFFSHDKVSGLPGDPKKNDIFYPNPSQDYIYLNYARGAILLEVLDMQGRPVLTKRLNGNDRISIVHIPEGTYILNLISKDKTVTSKMVIER